MDPREKNIDPKEQKISIALWVAVAVFILATLTSRVVYPEWIWLTVACALAAVGSLGAVLYRNQKLLKGRQASYGINSVVTTLLVVGIIGVLNFLSARYPKKADLTKNKIHTLSDQTTKVVKGLTQDVKAVYFSKANQREDARPILDDLKGLNPKFEVEFVDPDKDVVRAKQVAIKKYGTLQLIVGTKDTKLEEVNEEKITNALIKLLKNKTQTVCFLSGHGEHSLSDQGPDGYSLAKKNLEDQSYVTKEFTLVQENKIPEGCDVLAVVGPNKGFFEKEVALIQEYLSKGGRAIIALDPMLKGPDLVAELFQALGDWKISSPNLLVIDPTSTMFGITAAAPIIQSFSKEHPITKEMQGQLLFPMTRPIEVAPKLPEGLKVTWLLQTTPASWAETDLAGLSKNQVKKDAGDKPGPLSVAFAIDGKTEGSKAEKGTRMVVVGTSAFANNDFGRKTFNMDFFMNSVSWLMEDDSLISIRAKEEGASTIELSQKQGSFIFLLTVIILPALIAGAGIVLWFIRRRM